MPATKFSRDPETEKLWFSVSRETHDDLGVPFASRKPGDDHDRAAVRHHGRIVAYYGGWNGTYRTAEICARESIPHRIASLCGLVAS